MALLAKDTSSGADFEPAPEGNHRAVCVDVIDLGIIQRTYEGRTTDNHMVRFVWEIDETDEKGRPFLVFARYKVSLHEKANLRKMLDTWRGVKFTEAELNEGFNLEKTLGKSCLVNIVHNEGKEGRMYANVTAVTRLPKGTAPLEPSGTYTRPQPKGGAPPSASGDGAPAGPPAKTALDVAEDDLSF